MATPAQIAANRRNALLSTGPRTARGKYFSSRNRLRHGLRSRRLILPDENPADLARLLSTLGDLPLALAIWQFRRLERAELHALHSAALDHLLVLSTYRARLEHLFLNPLNPIPQLA